MLVSSAGGLFNKRKISDNNGFSPCKRVCVGTPQPSFFEAQHGPPTPPTTPVAGYRGYSYSLQPPFAGSGKNSSVTFLDQTPPHFATKRHLESSVDTARKKPHLFDVRGPSDSFSATSIETNTHTQADQVKYPLMPYDVDSSEKCARSYKIAEDAEIDYFGKVPKPFGFTHQPSQFPIVVYKGVDAALDHLYTTYPNCAFNAQRAQASCAQMDPNDIEEIDKNTDVDMET